MTEDLFFSFSDEDNDGILDSWELLFGLSPSDSSDALLDLDNDGFSNLQEFLSLGEPVNNALLPAISDISVTIEHKPRNYSDNVYINAILFLESGAALKNIVLLTIDSEEPFLFLDAQLQSSPAVQNWCTILNNGLQMQCLIENIRPKNDLNLELKLSAEQSYFDEISGMIKAQISYTENYVDDSNTTR